ncbi:MAG: SoxR reducing system RseC family protein [Thiolinea sp.]
MIEQTARVISLKQGYAWVEPLTSKGCGSCAPKSASCSSSGAFDFLKPAAEKIYVQNPLRARPGDEVVIGMQSNALLLYSLFAYLLPLLSMVIFAVLGKELFLFLDMHADMGAILAGVAGLFSGLKLAGWLAQNISKKGTQPVILRHKDKVIKVIEPDIPVSHA